MTPQPKAEHPCDACGGSGKPFDSNHKPKVGTKVAAFLDVDNPREDITLGVVLSHGRNAGGVYVRIRESNGVVSDWHPAYLICPVCLGSGRMSENRTEANESDVRKSDKF